MEVNGLSSNINIKDSSGTCLNDNNTSSKQTGEYKNVEKQNSNSQLSEQETIKLIEDANKRLIGSNTAVEYSIHEKTHEIMIKIINSETKEIIKEIPSEKILDLVAKFCEMAGLIVDEKI